MTVAEAIEAAFREGWRANRPVDVEADDETTAFLRQLETSDWEVSAARAEADRHARGDSIRERASDSPARPRTASRA